MIKGKAIIKQKDGLKLSQKLIEDLLCGIHNCATWEELQIFLTDFPGVEAEFERTIPKKEIKEKIKKLKEQIEQYKLI